MKHKSVVEREREINQEWGDGCKEEWSAEREEVRFCVIGGMVKRGVIKDGTLRARYEQDVRSR